NARPVPGYVWPPANKPPVTAVVAAGESHTFPDLVLEPAVPVDGVVVDAAGKPVPGVMVYAAHTDGGLTPPTTDAAGRFPLPDLGANDDTALRVRTPTAATAGAVPVSVKNLTGPVKLVV